MTTILKGTYSVTLVADGFTLSTNQFAYTAQDAIDSAIEYLAQQYGFQIEEILIDAEAEWIER